MLISMMSQDEAGPDIIVSGKSVFSQLHHRWKPSVQFYDSNKSFRCCQADKEGFHCADTHQRTLRLREASWYLVNMSTRLNIR